MRKYRSGISHFYSIDCASHVSLRFKNKTLMHVGHCRSASVQGPGLGMTDNGESVRTLEVSLDMYDTLKATIRRRNTDDLDESAGIPEDLERCVNYDKEKVEGQKLRSNGYSVPLLHRNPLPMKSSAWIHEPHTLRPSVLTIQPRHLRMVCLQLRLRRSCIEY